MEHAACMGRRQASNNVWLESLNKRENSEDLCVDGRMIVKWFLGK
jgi:hypothetical protein